MTLKSISSLCLVLLLLSISVDVKAIDEKDIPSQLKPWKSWVLHGAEDYSCPNPFNNGNEYLCLWPSRLDISLNETGGNFSQEFVVYSEGWVPLPGNMNAWPNDLTVDGKKTPVVNRSGIPSVLLQKGSHMVKGLFNWKTMPEMINIPEKTGLVDLVINKNPVESPLIDNNGRLWLQNKKTAGTEEDRLEVKLFRMIDDDIPMYITCLARLYVSGQAREVRLDDLLPADFIPMEIKSTLPVLIGEKGETIVQARPGKWDIYIKTRSKGPVNSVGPSSGPYGQEIWVVQSQNHLRMIKVQGVTGVDPGQTDLPAEWKSYPAYIVNKGDTLALEQIRRGDPSPAPDQLTMHRNIWLDFDGKGYTIQDNINGVMSSQWYLAVNPPVELGRVVLDGVDQLITAHGKDNKAGVELRKGSISLQGEARIEPGKSIIPAVGWDHDVQQLSASLNLPPGWRLINANGVDSIGGTWWQNWNLVDFFLVLVISTAIFRLYNVRYGMLALVTLVLVYHEPGSPRTIWIHLLAATALLRFIPQGWFRKIIELWRLASIIVLIVMIVPFVVNQARTGMYPQLERARHFSGPVFMQKSIVAGPEMQEIESARMALSRAPLPESEWDQEDFTLEEKTARSLKIKQGRDYYDKSRNVMLQDPNALIQTGPGLPQWQWHKHEMRWNGPVDSAQEISLWLLSPSVNLVLAFVRIILLILLALLVMDLKKIKIDGLKTAISAMFIFSLIIPGAGRAFADENADFPPPEILKEFKERLLEKDECFPYCADSPDMELT
ncbi:MAG: hypothetical protein JXL81_10575, partial [Deltaproteobacteria bacterium]|nr:hypothetical protein [Deltaproteobacteria bacterium]